MGEEAHAQRHLGTLPDRTKHGKAADVKRGSRSSRTCKRYGKRKSHRNDHERAEVAALLSQTMRDVSERKITLRQAMVVSRIALSLAKVIEVADLNDRVEFIEQTLKRRKSK